MGPVLRGHPRTRNVVLALAVSAVLTFVLYAPTLGYGFYYDDYHFVRPYTTQEVLRAFHGPWDASGIETAYYRPLTICLYAERFAVLGLNARAYHAASLSLFVVAATLFAVFVAEISGTALAGLIAATAFVVHPGMPYSAVAWITNQMHLAELIVVLAALIWWFQVRSRGPWWWIPLVAFQAAAFMIKEDGIMLIPTIVALHILRKYIAERDLPHVPLGVSGDGIDHRRRVALRPIVGAGRRATASAALVRSGMDELDPRVQRRLQARASEASVAIDSELVRHARATGGDLLLASPLHPPPPPPAPPAPPFPP